MAKHDLKKKYIYFASWRQAVGRRSMAEKADGLNGTIVLFFTSDNSRHDNETCRLLDVRNLTNPPDSVISSPKTKGFVIPQAEWS